MGTITLRQAAQWCGGSVDPKYENVTFFGANNDTRKIMPGQLFVALQGQRDGHDFIPAAMEAGAAAVLCTHCDGDYPAIVVEDTRLALGDIARKERERLGMKVVGVTGSVGKSTTKEMIASVLQTTFRVGKTPVNHNNDIGMPMSILAMGEGTQVAVLEMGMNHFREIAYLASIAKPDIGVIINIGTMHIEHLGSMEGILQAKLEIREGMSADGKLILNGDDGLLWNHQKQVSRPVEYFGINNTECSVLAENVLESDGKITFVANTDNGKFPVELSLEGLHYVHDALAAVAVGLELGVSTEKIQLALSEFRNMAGRQQTYEKNGFYIIEDCYNAGPESMAAALNVLGNRQGRKVAVLGDMLELGVCTASEHYKVGRIVAEKADILLAFGPNSSKMLNGAFTGGMTAANARAFTDRDMLVKVLKQMAKPGDTLLFKGSRGMRMELALEQFLQEEK
ncbi:MAG: UDP-N-acetylmuramoyl-tripeptide--D-alanyl-D-alanine ligase [Oscillospiraceae bacterium]|nr:UDP-N-acetylmuramoyl-tripeptide--D-alanyl-D-alanine ligase [Oscillospiraceae bacterium]